MAILVQKIDIRAAIYEQTDFLNIASSGSMMEGISGRPDALPQHFQKTLHMVKEGSLANALLIHCWLSDEKSEISLFGEAVIQQAWKPL